SLHRLSPGPDGGAGEVDVVLTGATTSNGLEWSPGGSLAYYNDTPTRQVAVFDYSREEGLTNRRVLVDVLDGEGKPDGLTVDAEGGIWVAVISHGQIHRYTPEGTLDEVVEVPVQKTTACTFGGEALGTLYITTSWENMERGEDPLAGALFAVRPGVTGLPARPFA
ncbi:SMP-30/gluconolactonase/LRE family protein, partial [Micrococcus endophyticus]